MSRIKMSASLELDEKEAAYLEATAKSKGMTQSAILRQALRTYQAIDKKLCQGGRLYFMDKQMVLTPLDGWKP